MEDLSERFFLFPELTWELEPIDYQGWILDIGGGGEGVIGQLLGSDVVAVDIRGEELREAPDGPLKVVMDARDLKFLSGSFSTATAFFSLMYLKTTQDQEQVLQEVWRVLKPGGQLHLWEIEVGERPDTDREYYLVRLTYIIRGDSTQTGYGMTWPAESRDLQAYHQLIRGIGFEELDCQRNGPAFYLKLQKPSDVHENLDGDNQ